MFRVVDQLGVDRIAYNVGPDSAKDPSQPSDVAVTVDRFSTSGTDNAPFRVLAVSAVLCSSEPRLRGISCVERSTEARTGPGR